jgi:hypothetical protein
MHNNYDRKERDEWRLMVTADGDGDGGEVCSRVLSMAMLPVD